MIKLLPLLKENKPCWKGYKQIGMKEKDGRQVPNCVPIDENKIEYYIDKNGNQFQTVDVNYLQYPGKVTIKYVDSNEPVEYKGNFEADLKTGIVRYLDSKIDEAFFIGEGDIKCEKCGWGWKSSDNDRDPYVCHKCGFDNSYRYNDELPGDTIDEYDVENEQDLKEFIQFMREYQTYLAEAECDCVYEAEYHGRKVSLGKPMQGDIKKFKVYVKNNKGKVVKVNFGAKGMNIKKNNPIRRKAFRARHKCNNPGPRTKARYWSCRKW